MANPVSIGLDIGSVSVRAAEVRRGKGRPMIDLFGDVALPDGAMSGGVIKDERAVTDAVRTLWSNEKFSSKKVRLGISHRQVVVREVEIANLPPKEMKQALPHQVRDSVPMPIEQAIFSFRPLEDAPKKETVRGLLIAAPKEPVLATVQAVERAGLHVEHVDLAAFAVLRAVASATTGAEAIVDIGASTTVLVIHRGGVPEIVRTIPRGGEEITRMLSARLGLSTAEADSLKRSLGEAPPQLRSDAVDAVRDALRPLISELRSSVTFYLNNGHQRSLNHVTVVGRASLLPGLADELHASTNVPVRAGDPLRFVRSAQHRDSRDELMEFRAAAAVSVGLNLGAAS